MLHYIYLYQMQISTFYSCWYQVLKGQSGKSLTTVVEKYHLLRKAPSYVQGITGFVTTKKDAYPQ